MLVQEEGNFQLGAHAVGAGDQDGTGHAGEVWGKLAAKITDAAQDAVDRGGLDQGLDPVDYLVAGGHVYAGGGVRVRFTIGMQKKNLLRNHMG